MRNRSGHVPVVCVAALIHSTFMVQLAAQEQSLISTVTCKHLLVVT